MRNTELTMAEYKIVDPSAIHIKGMTPADICGLHTLLKQEGCIDSENLFSDSVKAIALDGIQERLAKRNHTDKQASADMLICIANRRYVLADAKFRQENVKNISTSELESKLLCSKSIVESYDYTFANAFYVLFKKRILKPTQYDMLKRKFLGRPQYRFINALNFYEMFER